MGVMAAAFAAAALFQYNDPDPLRWVLIYAAAGALCAIAAVRGHAPVAAACLLAVIAFVWAVAVAATLPGLWVYANMLDARGMWAPGVEEARESSGLFLVAGCASIIGAASRRRRLR